MRFRFPLRHLIFAGALSVLAGCVSAPDYNETVERKPAMPTIRPAKPDDATTASDREVTDSVLNLARAGDVTGASKILANVMDPAARSRLTVGVATALAEPDPFAAAALAMGVPEGPAQSAAIDVAARAMVSRDPDAAFRWATEHRNDTSSRRASDAVTRELVGANPRPTIDRILALPAGAVRDDLLVAAAAGWARRDAEAAIAWLQERPADALRPRLVSSVGFAVAQTLPKRAIDVAGMLPEGRDRWLLLSAIAQTWIAVDSKAALAWASGMPAGAGRDAVYAGFETGLGVPVLRRVARAPGTRGAAPRTRGGIVSMAWPELDSPAFSSWLATQRPGMSHDEAVLEYVRQRGALEPGSVGQLLTSVPNGPTRDRAMELYLDNVLPTAPAEAASWLSSLPRSDRKDEMIDKTAQRWLQMNPAAASAWLDQLNLPPDRKEQLLRQAGR